MFWKLQNVYIHLKNAKFTDLPNLSENTEIFVFFIHSPWSSYEFSNLRNGDFVNSACMTCNLRVHTYSMYHACGSLLLTYHVSVFSKCIHMRAIIESCRLFLFERVACICPCYRNNQWRHRACHIWANKWIFLWNLTT